MDKLRAKKKTKTFRTKKNKTLRERALLRRGCKINCEYRGIVRTEIIFFPDTPPYKYPLLVLGVISDDILFQILLWRTCMLLLFIKFHGSIIISVMKLRLRRSQFPFLYFLYKNTLSLCTVNFTPSPATWLTLVHSPTKLAENAQSPQHRNINFMKSNNTQYKNKYKNTYSSKQN